jgi:hypothetical protein
MLALAAAATSFVPHSTTSLLQSVSTLRRPHVVSLDPALHVAPVVAALPPSDAVIILAQSVAMQAAGPHVAALVAAGLYIQTSTSLATVAPVEAANGDPVGLLETVFLVGLVATFFLSQQVVFMFPTLGSMPSMPNTPDASGDSPWSRVNPCADAFSSPAISWTAPLPTWEELVDACHAVAEDATGQVLFLCAEANNASCSLNDEISAKYGRPVFLCTI